MNARRLPRVSLVIELIIMVLLLSLVRRTIAIKLPIIGKPFFVPFCHCQITRISPPLSTGPSVANCRRESPSSVHQRGCDGYCQIAGEQRQSLALRARQVAVGLQCCETANR